MQVSLFKWAKLASGARPELSLMFAVPNGGKRDYVTAARMKAEGVKAGVPDVFLPVARGGYHGLWLELKAGKNTVSPDQLAWHNALAMQGYRVETVRDDWQAAQRIIEGYLLNREAAKQAKEGV